MQARAQRLAGKVAIVTGASRGLGQYCALAYAYEGAKVVVVARNATESPIHLPGTVYFTADMIEEVTGSEALPIVCDISDQDAVERMVDEVLKKWGRADILLNNAAYVAGESVSGVPPRVLEQMLHVNVLGSFYVTRALQPFMRSQRSGTIVNVSGRSRTRGSPLEVTKYGVEAMTVGLADELRPYGVAVNCVRPAGFIDTPGVLLNPEVKPRDLMPPYSYIEATILLGMQSAETYTGQVRTDAEVIRDLGDAMVLRRLAALNPPEWEESLVSGSASRFLKWSAA